MDAAYARCLALTREHYENFPVARLVPKRLRAHVAAIYAFARYADDIADEGWGENGAPTPQERVAALDAFEGQLWHCVKGEALDPQTEWIFKPLGHTLKQFDIPPQLCADLLSAFKQDCVTLRYQTFADVLDYCRRSANPVGRIVLLLHGFNDATRFAQSDAICTALQLANFWQDVGVDMQKDGRIYIPQEDWQTFGVTEADFFVAPTAGNGTTAGTPQNLRKCIRFQVKRTAELFATGKPLPNSLPFPLSLEIRLTWLGGSRILQKTLALDCDTLIRRPKITKADKLRLLARSLFPN